MIQSKKKTVVAMDDDDDDAAEKLILSTTERTPAMAGAGTAHRTDRRARSFAIQL